jgi:hypothetical protein
LNGTGSNIPTDIPNTVIFDSSNHIPSKILVDALELLNSEKGPAKDAVIAITSNLLEKYNQPISNEQLIELAFSSYHAQLEQKMHTLFDPFL